MSQHTIRQTILHYAGSNLVRQLLGMLTTLVRSRLLSPEQFGLWSLLNLIPQYAGFLHLGSRSTLSYRIPPLEQRADHVQAGLIRGTVWRASLIPNLLLALALLGYAWLWAEGPLQDAVLASALVVMTNWWFEHQVALLKAQQQFRPVTISNYLRAITILAATLALLPLWGVIGALLAIAIGLLLTGAYLYPLTRPLAQRGFHWPLLLELMRQGMPLLGVSLVLLLMRNIDRVLIGAYLGLHAVGLYALGGMILGFLMNVPGVSREVLEPRLMQEMANGIDAGLVQRYLLDPLFKSAVLMPLLLAPVEIILPVVIEYLLPAYRDGLPAIRTVLLGSFFLALLYPLRGLMVAGSWQSLSLRNSILALLAALAANLLILRSGGDLIAVGVVSVMAFALLFTLDLAGLARRLHIRHRLRLRRPLLLWLSALITAGGLAIGLETERTVLGLSAWLLATLQLVTFLSLYGGVAWYLLQTHSQREGRHAG